MSQCALFHHQSRVCPVEGSPASHRTNRRQQPSQVADRRCLQLFEKLYQYLAYLESIAARSIASFSAFGTQGGSSNTLSAAQLDNLFVCNDSLLRKTGWTKITVFLSSQRSPNLLLCLRRRYHTRHSCGSGKGRPLWSSRPQRS